MNPSAPANFRFNDWEEQTDSHVYEVPELNRRDLPKPPDRYRPGHLTMGCNPDRGLAIQRSRGRKRAARNLEFFRAEVLPLIEADLNLAAVRELSAYLGTGFLVQHGFVRYAAGERAAWIHPTHEPDKLAQAIQLGATPQPVAA